MEIRYVKRLQMVRSLKGNIPEPVLPEGYLWLPWSHKQVEIHGRLIYQSFVEDLDGMIFPTFRQYGACQRLMQSVASMRTFLPKGTWLIALPNQDGREKYQFCATIQGIRSEKNIAMIQNVAVHPSHRRLGLARALMLKAMAGFFASGCESVSLTVTAENTPARHLYESLGFQIALTSYREVYME